MFDVKVKQSMDVQDFCEEHWDDISNDINRNIRDYLQLNFGNDSPIMDIFIHTNECDYMPEILEGLIKVIKKRKEIWGLE